MSETAASPSTLLCWMCQRWIRRRLGETRREGRHFKGKLTGESFVLTHFRGSHFYQWTQKKVRLLQCEVFAHWSRDRRKGVFNVLQTHRRQSIVHSWDVVVTVKYISDTFVCLVVLSRFSKRVVLLQPGRTGPRRDENQTHTPAKLA